MSSVLMCGSCLASPEVKFRLNNYANYALDVVVWEGVAERSKLGWTQASRVGEGRVSPVFLQEGLFLFLTACYLRCYFNQRFLCIIHLSPNGRWVRAEGPENFAVSQPA